MSRLNIDLDYPSHPKTVRLIAIVGEAADAYPIRMWAYLGKFHERDGAFTGYTDGEIEGVLHWKGEPGRLVAALVKVGYLEKDGDWYKAHDWLEHEGHIFAWRVRGRANAKKRWGNAVSNAVGNAPSVPYHPYHTVPNQPKEKNTMLAPEAQASPISTSKEVVGGDNTTKNGKKGKKVIPEAQIPLFEEVIGHLSGRWEKEKGVGLQITGKIRGILAAMCRTYEPEGVMALWDMWWERGAPWSDWAGQTGRSVEGFAVKVAAILDDPRWKGKRLKYQKQFGRDPETQMAKIRQGMSAGGIVGGMLKIDSKEKP